MQYPLPKHRAKGVAEHAIGLAEIAETVVLTSPGNPVAQAGLIITQLPPPLGVRVSVEDSPDAVLHVDVQGQVYTYKPDREQGGWEQRLVQAVTAPVLSATRVQVTVEVPPQTLRAAAAQARETQPERLTPLELVGLASVHAAMALRYPLMP
jgi:hypothetical protein